MSNRHEFNPYRGEGGMPLCCMWDATQLSLSANVNPAATITSGMLDVTGLRRFRLKVFTAGGPTRVRIFDMPFGQTAANAWQTIVLAAAQGAAARATYDWGEGVTAALVLPMINFMGPFLVIDLQNNGGGATTYEVELWAQG